MNTLGSVASVIAAVREEASAEMSRLAREAAATREMLAERADRPQADVDHERRIAEARLKAHRLQDEASWQDALIDLQEREAWFAAVAAAARERLADPRDPEWIRNWMAALVLEAFGALPAGPCTVQVRAAWAGHLTSEWRARVEEQSGRTIRIEPGAVTAGCTVRLAGTPIAYDNSFEARERRLQAASRAALARRYDAALAAADPEPPISAELSAAGHDVS